MKIRRCIASFLLVSFLSVFTPSISNDVLAEGENQSLQEFIQTTDNIEASYQYPSMILSYAGNGKSLLEAHTPIMIRCEEDIKTRDIVSGGTVNFSVVGDVKDSNGHVLIKAGAPVTAQISFVKDSDLLGRSGEITVTDFHTKGVDGTYIPLSGSVSAKPDDKLTLSIVLSVLVCPLFLLMKGEEARLPVGATKTAYTITDTYIKPVRL